MNDEVLELLKKTKAIFSNDHFVFTNGNHASRYMNKMALFAHPIYTSRIGEIMAEKYKDKDIEAVVAPALGGIILSTWTAFHLSQITKKDIPGVYTEKTPTNKQLFTRGYDEYVKGKRVLVVEDNVTTGGSVRKVVDAVKAANGTVIGVCSIANINKNPTDITDKIIGAHFEYLVSLPAITYDVAECPMCKKGLPINTKLGHGKKYLAEKAKRK
jgi:orotate phosphoribosyltransferase